ncbi:MAG: PEP-CTERM sorting domain-containing protein, partial [Verrucomicrobiaceae bacterium]
NLINLTLSGGQLLNAVNFTLAGQAAPTRTPLINGIQFTPVDVTGATSYSGTGFELTGLPNTTLIHDGNRTSGVANTAEIYPLIYNAVVSPVQGGTPAASVLRFTISGLTIDQEYVVQFVFSSDAASRQVTLMDNIGSSSTPGTSGNISYGTTNGPQVVTGTFTADAATQSYDVVATVSATRVQFSGFTVQAVPEPSTVGLLTLGAGMVLGFRRRREQKRS